MIPDPPLLDQLHAASKLAVFSMHAAPQNSLAGIQSQPTKGPLFRRSGMIPDQYFSRPTIGQSQTHCLLQARAASELPGRDSIPAYEEDSRNGDLPESLDPLVPDYFDELPRDWFNGGPIKYDREKAIVYCVGPDLKDNGGSDPDVKWTTSEDPSWSIAFSEVSEQSSG